MVGLPVALYGCETWSLSGNKNIYIVCRLMLTTLSAAHRPQNRKVG